MNHNIPFEQAVEMTRRYRENRTTVLNPDYSTDILALCETFDKETIQSVLDQDKCVSMRIYYGMDAELNIHAILVGVDENDIDIIPNEYPGGLIVENGHRCPYTCPPTSPLNGE